MTDRLAVLQSQRRAFVEDRKWERYHDPKNLAMAVAGEAGELAAELQWLTSEEARSLSNELRARVADEAADVYIYLLHLADQLGVDLIESAISKMERNEERYPAREDTSG